MKQILFILFFFFLASGSGAQNLNLKIEGSNPKETAVIDSISYIQKHENVKSITDQAYLLAGKLQKAGFLETEINGPEKANDSTFVYQFTLGKKTKNIHIYTGNISKEEKVLLDIKNDTIKLPLYEAELFMNNAIASMEQKGYSLSSLQLVNYFKTENILHASLVIKSEKKRTLDGLVLQGYDKFPAGISKNILKQYKGKVFNQQTLARVHNDFSAIRFINQPRYPEILFTQDSTKVYVYLEKSKPNTFDGFIGFSNDDDNKIVFNGYLDLQLINVLNSGEKFKLFWKSDGNKQTTFNAGLELPYVFKSPLGVKGNLQIFKQDSTFQNTVTDLNIGYFFSYNSKLYLGYQQTQSVDIQNLNSSTLSDYSNSFWTSTYEFTQHNINDFLFPEKTSLFFKAGTGKRNSKAENNQQYFVQLNLAHNLYLNKKNIIALKNETYYLDSDSYIINELYRFGGINSIRGFNENSLQANLYSALMVEYRYVIAPNIYAHTITDYGYFQDQTTNIKDNILGLGFGFGLLTKTGLFNIVYANGSTKNQPVKLANSIVHISFKTSF